MIAWDNGAMRETIKRGVTGTLVRSHEELVEAIRWYAVQEFQDWRDMRRNCREWASQFSVDKMILRYQELCQEAVVGGW